MKPLLAVVVALLIVQLDKSTAAPQPLSLLNSTDIDDRGTDATDEDATKLSTLVSVNDGTSTAASSSRSPVNDDSEESTDILPDTESSLMDANVAERRSDSDLSSEKVFEETTIKQDGAGFTTSAAADALTTRSESINTAMKDLNDDAKQPEETIGEVSTKEDIPEDVTISRYVPPLDPMKHMLMMAEVRKQLELSSTDETSEVSSTQLPTTSESIKVKDETNSEEIEKPSTESSETEELHISTMNSEISSPVPVKYSGDLISSAADSSVESSETSTERPTTILPVSENTEITSVTDSFDSLHEINHENSSLIRSSELLSGRNESLIVESSTEIDEPKKSESTDQSEPITFTESSSAITTLESHSTDAIPSSTDIKSEESVEEISLVRSEDETDSVEISETEEITTVPPTEKTTILSEKELDSFAADNAPSSSVIYSDSGITTTFKPDLTTNKILEKLSASEDEAPKNITLEEELEFREGNVVSNISNVIYHDETTDPSVNTEGKIDNSSTEKFSSENNEETTTLGFFTTIRDIIFGTSTIAPEKDTENPKAESSDLNTTILENERNPENLANSEIVDVADARSESDLPVENPSSDLIKVELVKEDVDHISTDSPHTSTSTISDQEPTTDLSNYDSSKDAIPTENESSSEHVKEDFTNTETVESFTAKDQMETSTFSEIMTTDAPPEKSELLKSSDPESIIELSNDSSTEDNSKADERLLVKSSTKDRYVSGNNTDSVAAVQFLHYHDKASSEQCFKLVDAHWKYATNLTDENKKKQLEQTLEYSLFHKEAWKNATSFAWKSFNDTLLRRWFKSLSVLGTAALPEDKLNEFNRLKAEMKNTYSTAKICPYVSPQSKENSSVINPKDCKLTLEPDVQRILTKSRDYDELTHVWKAWRDAAGKPIREKYLRFVNLSNEAARLNGFPDTGDMWREAYESDTFQEDLERLWDQLKPLYEHLHAYVRRKLIHVYGNDKIKDDGPIPAHLFGNMWAQSCSLLDITQRSQENHLSTSHPSWKQASFHEAIGDVLALSVSTPAHLQSIGLLEEVADDPEGDLNFLLRTALDKVSFLPSGYLIDLWRWGLFSGEIKPEEMNSKWWDLRLKYQGICPPVRRYDTDFDPGAKYHVPGNVPYIRYFVSFVIQFQFHKVLCDAAGHTGPLYKCDIYRSKEAGQILSQVMELGSSEHWSEAMKIMTGGATNKMDAGPILEYFHPLMEFLGQQNQNETLGWRSDDSTICP
ncbi:angiotensin-converting enzyme [Nephila pilipes]|uniref:Angiotensin-converting enzyme n=1 Tax=Nephila pilipes TaxID=299642 RepID=A0A8X6THH4_NEPPI|nr:angiotensin-converting enzyme [Nephila pilipes]